MKKKIALRKQSMKKKIALLLSAAMAVGMLPSMTAFAGVDNRITRTVSATEESYVTNSSLIIEEEDGDLNGDFTFSLTLNGAEWGYIDDSDGNALELDDDDFEELMEGTYTLDDGSTGDGITVVDANTGSADGLAIDAVQKVTDTMLIVKVTGATTSMLPKISIPLYSQITGSEEATVSIDPLESGLSRETLTYATIISGSTTVTIEDSVTVDSSSTEIETIIIKENVTGTITNGTLKLKLAGEFAFTNSASDPIKVSFISGSADVDEDGTNGSVDDVEYDEDIIQIPLENRSGKLQLVISGIEIAATDDADAGDVAEITVSGAGVSSTTIEVGTYAEYDVVVSVEDDELPVIYAGTDNTTETLEVTLKESVTDSWLSNRKTTFTFPSDVRVKEVQVNKSSGVSVSSSSFSIKDNVATLSGLNKTGKVTLELEFVLSVDPAYEGDITCTVGGAALSEDTELVVATAKPLFSIESDVNEVILDYRQTEIGDLIVSETAAGNWEKGDTLHLYVEEMNFESGTTYEIVEGDIKIDSVKVSGGTIDITVKSASVKTPAVIKLSNLSLYMSRDLPAGDYRLYAIYDGTDSIGFANYDEDDEAPGFDTEEVLLMDDFVKVVTAGRDQDDSTFTTTVSVTIGATEMTAGNTTIALDAPAYISNGYTMLPVRAVAEALSGSAQVTWDDATKTVVIFFGSRIIKMTIGQSDMIINGTSTAMSAPAEITNSRTFIPLRDLGYALGLNDDKINWDDATKTATLN